jgi:hypothetical protein
MTNNREPVEQQLINELDRLDPGPAPARLRRRALDVPATSPAGGRTGWGLRQGIEAVLGVAAAVLLAVIGLTVLNGLGVAPQVAGPVPTPGASAVPIASAIPFEELTLVGPGMVAPTSGEGPAVAVGAAIVVLGLLAITMMGRRRLVPAATAIALAVYAVVATQVPVSFHTYFSGLGLHIEEAASAPGSSELLYYETAPARSLFVIGTGWRADSPLPVRVEGFVDQQFGYGQGFIGMQWVAVWLDGAQDSGVSGPNRPFTPIEMPAAGQGFWFVGRAGACALGPAFDPAHPDNVGVWTSPAMFDVLVSVLGWPRVIHVEPPFGLVEPGPPSCSGDATP